MRLDRGLDYFLNVTLRQLPIFYKIYSKQTHRNHKIIGLIRERNEELLLEDSLNHLSKHVDAIVVFDDASTDKSVEIALNHPSVIEVIVNRRWRPKHRIWEEAANRQKLHRRSKRFNPDWFFYADADERFEGNIKEYLLKDCPSDVDSVRISLFDAYITPSDKIPFDSSRELYNFRKFFGPERRDIRMIWRNIPGIEFNRKDGREPQAYDHLKTETLFYCQHYGKALSIKHWEDTCDYYINFFPKYSDKWKERKGKAIHSKSDFNRPLYEWDKVKISSIKIN